MITHQSAHPRKPIPNQDSRTTDDPLNMSFRTVVVKVAKGRRQFRSLEGDCLAANRRLSSASHVGDPFSPENLERTLRELNDPSLKKKIYGGYEADGSTKQSSVLIPLCRRNGQPSVLFNLRSTQLSRHKGYPCFPGGVAEEGDKDSVHTALRETHEELGLEAQNMKVIGTFPRFRMPRDKMEITAVVADIGDIDSHKLKINYDEVSLVFSRTIEELTAAENTGETVFRNPVQDSLYATPVFLAGPYKIWGVTAMLLHIFLSRLVPHLSKGPVRPVRFKRKYNTPQKNVQNAASNSTTASSTGGASSDGGTKLERAAT